MTGAGARKSRMLWTSREQEILREVCANGRLADAGAALPRRSASAVRSMAVRMGLIKPEKLLPPTDEQIATVRGRMMEGASIRDCAIASGLSPSRCRRLCDQIAATLGVSTPQQQRQARRQGAQGEVAALVDEGLTDREIAKRLGRSITQVKGAIQAANLQRFRATRLTDDMREELKQRLLAGKTIRSIAAALNCDRKTVYQYREALRRSGAHDGLPPCRCGQPALHSGKCAGRHYPQHGQRGTSQPRSAGRGASHATLQPAISGAEQRIEAALRRGVPVSRILKRTGATRATVARIRQRLSDHRRLPTACECGKPIGHGSTCVGRRTLPVATAAAVARAAYEGEGVLGIVARTGVSGKAAVRELNRRTERADENRLCQCGRPWRHGGSCPHNGPGRVLKPDLAQIKAGLRAGEPTKQIAIRLGFHHRTILIHARPIREGLALQGVRCPCGKPIGHGTWCEAKAAFYPAWQREHAIPAELRSAIVEALVAGYPVTEVRKIATTSVSKVRLVRSSLTTKEALARQRTKELRRMFGAADVGRRVLAHVQSVAAFIRSRADRDEVVSAVTAAVLTGAVAIDRARHAISGGLKDLHRQRQYGPRSLDEKIRAGDEGSSSFGDLAADHTTLDEVDDIQIGRRDD